MATILVQGDIQRGISTEMVENQAKEAMGQAAEKLVCLAEKLGVQGHKHIDHPGVFMSYSGGGTYYDIVDLFDAVCTRIASITEGPK